MDAKVVIRFCVYVGREAHAAIDTISPTSRPSVSTAHSLTGTAKGCCQSGLFYKVKQHDRVELVKNFQYAVESELSKGEIDLHLGEQKTKSRHETAIATGIHKI